MTDIVGIGDSNSRTHERHALAAVPKVLGRAEGLPIESGRAVIQVPPGRSIT